MMKVMAWIVFLSSFPSAEKIYELVRMPLLGTTDILCNRGFDGNCVLLKWIERGKRTVSRAYLLGQHEFSHEILVRDGLVRCVQRHIQHRSHVVRFWRIPAISRFLWLSPPYLVFE